MDEDERYNRKLESGLYTLQVKNSVLCPLALDLCSCLDVNSLVFPCFFAYLKLFIHDPAVDCCYFGSSLVLWVSLFIIAAFGLLFVRCVRFGIGLLTEFYQFLSGTLEWERELNYYSSSKNFLRMMLRTYYRYFSFTTMQKKIKLFLSVSHTHIFIFMLCTNADYVLLACHQNIYSLKYSLYLEFWKLYGQVEIWQ